MIRQLAHICLRTEDLEKTAAYYCQALGMERFFDFERNGACFGYYLKAGANTFIEVFKGNPGMEGNIRHFALEVEGIDELIARIRRHGAPVTDKKLGADQSWQAWTEDPSGVKIELHQYTPESSQLTGRCCVVDW
jgi:catechol 2,3-dioxygenase-like lactoylglutathione lyase family enzyme